MILNEIVNNFIVDLYKEKQKYDEKLEIIMKEFISKAYEVVNMSDGLYQIESTIVLNKISLKDYILNSEICKSLKENNVIGYSIDYLKKYMDNYEKNVGRDVYSFKEAIKLYEMLKDLEKQEKDKINILKEAVIQLVPDIITIDTINRDNYQQLYNKIIEFIKGKYLNSNIIDENIYEYFVQILNDVFNYYLNGNTKILVN